MLSAIIIHSVSDMESRVSEPLIWIWVTACVAGETQGFSIWWE